MPEVRLQRPLRVPADSAAEALAELLKAIADQQGMWRGFALHVGLGELHLPDVGYVAVPIDLTVARLDDPPRTFDIGFVATGLPSAFPAFTGKMSVETAGMGESMLFLDRLVRASDAVFRTVSRRGVDAARRATIVGELRRRDCSGMRRASR